MWTRAVLCVATPHQRPILNSILHSFLWPNSWSKGSILWVEATTGNCTPLSCNSVIPSKFPRCMKSRSRWEVLWSEEIFLHHRVLSSYSKLSTQWRPLDDNLKTRTRVHTCDGQMVLWLVNPKFTNIKAQFHLDAVFAHLTLFLFQELLDHRRAP